MESNAIIYPFTPNPQIIPFAALLIKEIAGGVPEPGRSFNFSLKYDF